MATTQILETFNPNQEEKANKTKGNIASKEEQEKNLDAIKLIKEIGESSEEHFENYLNQFTKCHTEKKLNNIIQTIRRFLHVLARFEFMSVKKKKDSKSCENIKKEYNKTLNNLRGVVASDSSLKNLLFLNDNLKFIKKREIKERNDCVNLSWGYEEKLSGPYILHLRKGIEEGIKGGRTCYDNPNDLLVALIACMENTNGWDKLVKIDNQKKTELGQVFIYNARYALKINLSNWIIQTDDSSIRHILCEGNPPINNVKMGLVNLHNPTKEFKTLYPYYTKFLNHVKDKVKWIINESFNDNNCPYVSLTCCRIEPPCSYETYCLKRDHGGKRMVECEECEMELCTGGCGRISHGDTPCELTFDEASATLIQTSTKMCPNSRCQTNITKSDGCNHITCTRCRCEFCWICGQELPRDRHGHYSTELHYSHNSYGIGVSGGCNQFN
jgi:hypothetical protein